MRHGQLLRSLPPVIDVRRRLHLGQHFGGVHPHRAALVLVVAAMSMLTGADEVGQALPGMILDDEGLAADFHVTAPDREEGSRSCSWNRTRTMIGHWAIDCVPWRTKSHRA